MPFKNIFKKTNALSISLIVIGIIIIYFCIYAIIAKNTGLYTSLLSVNHVTFTLILTPIVAFLIYIVWMLNKYSHSLSTSLTIMVTVILTIVLLFANSSALLAIYHLDKKTNSMTSQHIKNVTRVVKAPKFKGLGYGQDIKYVRILPHMIVGTSNEGNSVFQYHYSSRYYSSKCNGFMYRGHYVEMNPQQRVWINSISRYIKHKNKFLGVNNNYTFNPNNSISVTPKGNTIMMNFTGNGLSHHYNFFNIPLNSIRTYTEKTDNDALTIKYVPQTNRISQAEYMAKRRQIASQDFINNGTLHILDFQHHKVYGIPYRNKRIVGNKPKYLMNMNQFRELHVKDFQEIRHLSAKFFPSKSSLQDYKECIELERQIRPGIRTQYNKKVLNHLNNQPVHQVIEDSISHQMYYQNK